MEYVKPFIAAEIGCNHKGNMEIRETAAAQAIAAKSEIFAYGK